MQEVYIQKIIEYTNIIKFECSLDLATRFSIWMTYVALSEDISSLWYFLPWSYGRPANSHDFSASLTVWRPHTLISRVVYISRNAVVLNGASDTLSVPPRTKLRSGVGKDRRILLTAEEGCMFMRLNYKCKLTRRLVSLGLLLQKACHSTTMYWRMHAEIARGSLSPAES